METPDSAPFALAVRAIDAGAVVVELVGDFDVSGVEEFRSCVEELIRTSPDAVLVVDLGGVTFIDSRAISALLEARRFADHERRELRLQHISAPVSRLLKLTGLTEVFDDDSGPPA